MKKKLLAVLVCVLALSVVISGCGPKATPAPEVVEEAETVEEATTVLVDKLLAEKVI